MRGGINLVGRGGVDARRVRGPASRLAPPVALGVEPALVGRALRWFAKSAIGASGREECSQVPHHLQAFQQLFCRFVGVDRMATGCKRRPVEVRNDGSSDDVNHRRYGSYPRYVLAKGRLT